jgi:hypothetical protein
MLNVLQKREPPLTPPPQPPQFSSVEPFYKHTFAELLTPNPEHLSQRIQAVENITADLAGNNSRFKRPLDQYLNTVKRAADQEPKISAVSFKEKAGPNRLEFFGEDVIRVLAEHLPKKDIKVSGIEYSDTLGFYHICR